jgi:hypothetical protein
MNLKRFTFLCVALLLVSGMAYAEPRDGEKALTVRTFQFKYKDADKATAIVKPLLSAEGSISLQAGSNALVVSDRPENLKEIAAALAKYDAAPQMFRLEVRLVAASRDGNGNVPAELKDIAGKLALLRFNTVESLGSADMTGHEGDPGTVSMQSGYKAEFRLGDYDPASDTLRVNDFKVSKMAGDQLTQVLKMSMNLKLNQTVILGATKVVNAGRALMIVVTAKR